MARISAKKARSFVVGAIALAVIGAICAFSAFAQYGMPGSASTMVKAAFDDVGSLQEGDQVRQHSMRIGQVTDIAFENDKAVVTLEIEGHHTVYRNAQAHVSEQSPLGQKFVQLNTGTRSSGPLGDSVIPEVRTRDSKDLYQLLNALDGRTRAALKQSVTELGTGAAGHGRDLHDAIASAPDMLRDLGTFSAAASSPDANFAELLRHADTLFRRFEGRQDEIAELVDQSGDTTSAFAVDGGTRLRETLGQLPSALRATHRAMRDLDEPLADTSTALAQIRPGARALGEATPALRGVLREAVPPMRKVPEVARQATPAIEDLTGMVADARPLAPRFTQAMSYAAPPLQVLAPYAPEIVGYFVNGKSALSGHVGSDHWLRLAVAISGPGNDATRDPLLRHEPYPAPGEARPRVGTTGGAK